MVNGNLFYVHPGGDLTPGMSGLQQGLARVAERKEKADRERRYAEDYKEAMMAFRSGDFDKIAAVSMKNPQIGRMLTDLSAHKNKQTEQNYYYSMYKVLEDDSPENVQKVVENRKKILQSQGVGPEASIETDTFMQRFMENPAKMKKRLEMELAVKDPQRYTLFKKAMGAGSRDLTDEEKEYQTAVDGGFDGSFLEYKLQVGGKDKTDAIREYEYSVKNPGFVNSENQKKDAEKTRANQQKIFKLSSDLRKEFLSQSGEYQKVRDAYTRVKSSTENPSPAGDLSLIFNYMKMLDPGSVVRESEFQTAASAGSYGERIKAAVQRVGSGERLTDVMRRDFISKSNELFKGAERQHKRREKNYRGIAKKNNLPEDEVVVDITEAIDFGTQKTENPVSQMTEEQLRKAAFGGQ